MAFEEPKSISTQRLIGSAVYSQHGNYIGMMVEVNRETAQEWSFVVQQDKLQSQPSKLRINSKAIQKIDVDCKKVYVNLESHLPHSMGIEALPLWQERLVVNRRRRKVGEVSVRKVVDVHTVEVPIRSERLVIENVADGHILAEVGLSTTHITQDKHPDGAATSADLASPVAEGHLSGFHETIRFLESVNRFPKESCRKLQIALSLQGNQPETVIQTFESVQMALEVLISTASVLAHRTSVVRLKIHVDDRQRAETYQGYLSRYAQSSLHPKHSKTAQPSHP